MKLGISTYTYTWSIGVAGQMPAEPVSALQLVQQAANLQVDVLQMADNLALDRLTGPQLDEFAARAEALGIAIEVGTRGIAPEHLRTYLALAQRLHSPIVRVVVDDGQHHPAPRDIVETLSPLRGEFEAAGVTLAIENHDRFTSQTLANIVNRLGSTWVGICLDTVNSFGALEGPQAVVETLGPLTVNLHVKDFTIFRANHNMGFTIEGRPAGQGRLDLPWLLEQLRAFGRDPNAILELWTPPEATLAETIAKEQKWAELSIAYLQEAIRH